MRWRRYIHLLLAGLLVLAQAGGAAHAISHHAGGDERQDHGSLAGDPCDLCAAYSATGHALGPTPVPPPGLSVDRHAFAGDVVVPAFLAPPARRARGPPLHA